MITTPIFTRLLSISEYGQFSVFNSWLGIVSVIVTMNLCNGIYAQGMIKFDNEKNIFSSSLQGLTLTFVLAWSGIYVVFHTYWNELLSLTTIQVLLMLLMIWTSASFGFWAAEQRILLSYKKLIVVTLAVSVAKPLLSIFLIYYFDDKVTARIFGLAVAELAGYAWTFFIQMKNGKKYFSLRFWKYAVIFGIPLIPHYLAQTLLNNADRIMINRYVGEAETGVYSLAYSVSLIMMMLNNAVMQTISPWIYQKIKDKKVKDIAGMAYPTLGIIAIVNLFLIALAPEIVAIFAPESYYDAIWVIPPITMSVYFMFAYDLFAKFQFYYEKTWFIMAASIFAAVLNIILNYIFINKCGYYAAGYTTLFCYIVYTIGHYCFMQKVCKEEMGGVEVYDVKILIAITISFIVCGFILLGTYRFGVVRYLFIGVLCIGVLIKRKVLVEVIFNLLERNLK